MDESGGGAIVLPPIFERLRWHGEVRAAAGGKEIKRETGYCWLDACCGEGAGRERVCWLRVGVEPVHASPLLRPSLPLPSRTAHKIQIFPPSSATVYFAQLFEMVFCLLHRKQGKTFYKDKKP